MGLPEGLSPQKKAQKNKKQKNPLQNSFTTATASSALLTSPAESSSPLCDVETRGLKVPDSIHDQTLREEFKRNAV